jgi:DNA-binding PadR family transcriptional regulator
MSAKHAVLGLVIERPGYGYDLARRLRERFGSSGFAPTGVYSALDQLSAEGLVRAAGARPGGGASERAAPRTVYEATPQGQRQFDRWMAASAPPAHVRDELNMKLSLSRARDLPSLVEQARAQEAQCLQRLEAIRRGDAGERRPAQGAELAWPRVAALLVRDAEVRQLQTRIEWLQRARAIMTRLLGEARAAQRQPHDEAGGEESARYGEAQGAGGGGAGRQASAGDGEAMAEARVA